MTRVRLLWEQVRTSLWLLPTLLTLAAILLAFLLVAVDRSGVLDDEALWFAFAAGAEGARGVLSTIAGSIITVTGVVFSITIVVLQLASSQFTPRILRSFTEDRVNQVVLGVFIGTFTYSLLVLRTVRSSIDDADAFVPVIAVTVAVLLALVSIGVLIYFINHVAHSIQAEVILARVTDDALQIVASLFPEELGEPFDRSTAQEPAARPAAGEPVALRARQSGYLQAADEDGLTALAEEHDVVIELQHRIGEFVLEGDELLLLHGRRGDGELEQRIHASVTLGPQRTRYQDVERGIIELTDIGVRALSPGINDPTTALACIDRLTQIMTRLVRRRFPSCARAGRDGRIRVIAPRPSFEDIVRLGYAPLRHHGRDQPEVAIALAASLSRVIAHAPLTRHAPLRDQLQYLLDSAHREWQSAPNLARLDDAARTGLTSTGHEADTAR